MGMNVNRGLFNFKPNWKDSIQFNPSREIRNPNTPIPSNMETKNNRSPNLDEILKNLDNPDIPKFE